MKIDQPEREEPPVNQPDTSGTIGGGGNDTLNEEV